MAGEFNFASIRSNINCLRGEAGYIPVSRCRG